MFAPTHDPVTDHYSVEVSGWDVSEGFYVEKCQLAWNEKEGKSVTLHRMLPEGAHVFVRLLQSLSPERSHAVAYEARFSGTQSDGSHQFQLVAILPSAGNAPGS